MVSQGRWRRSLALVAVFAVGCGLLSWWQFARRAETVRETALVAANTTAPAVPLTDLVPSRSVYRDDLDWRTIRVTGTYLSDEQLLVRNRVHRGDPGFEVLTPLRLDDGSVFVLDRGWVSIGTRQDLPDAVPPPPAGRVVVEARLQSDEGALAGRTAAEGQIPSVDLGAVGRGIDAPTWTGAYGQVRSESPAAAAAPVRLAPRVDVGVDEGTHLSYAIQWILFAAIAFGGLGWAIRRDLRDAGDEAVLAADARAETRRARRAPSDESVEDALS